MKFLHPNVETRIIDNSQVYLTAEGTTVLFAAFASAKGVDSKLTRLTTPSEAIFNFGNPNIAKYGQTLYQVINWLQGGGEVYAIRVLPEDARYATMMWSIGIGTVNTSRVVRLYSENLTSNNTTVDSMETKLNAGGTPDGNFTKYPLAIFRPKGRGQYYNGIGARLSLLDSMDATYEFRTYNLEITAIDVNGDDQVVEGPYMVSFDPSAKSRSGESLYYVNVVNKYSQYLDVIGTADHLDKIQEFINPDANPLHLDIITGTPREFDEPSINNSTLWASSDVVSTADNYIATTSKLVGTVNRIMGGTDGTWAGGNSEEALLVKAYSGLIDENVIDTKFYEFDVLLDANYPLSVKNAMVDLADNIRGDCVVALDVGFQANSQQTVAARTNDINMSSYRTAIFAHDMTVYDEFNGQNMKVTISHLLSNKIINNDNMYGIQYPFVGPRRGTVSGFSNLNFIPNTLWKETFYKKQINYIEQDPRRFNLATQRTSQTINSALSQFSNVRVLMKIKRTVENILADFRMEFSDSQTLSAAQYDVSNALKMWVTNRACRSISAKLYQSEYDRNQNIARCRIDVQFTGFIERFAVDIVVNR